ncbi:hypothetical protein [Streptomyces virginiae]|uniref:hypothetical protein n=1 Tax=Streptomyces virginiae TaxID=1961 RepID=UPI002254F43E|nr:hypothetical protein [Streptomyces virginiae]MCX4956989.1 hypothetical protein [Streptomyces virginiae]
MTDVGTLCWTELDTGDVAGATEFCRAVFGWGATATPYEGGTYAMAKPAGTTDEAAFGGLVPLSTGPGGGSRTALLDAVFRRGGL